LDRHGRRNIGTRLVAEKNDESVSDDNERDEADTLPAKFVELIAIADI
jgi:hypothetical protein